MLQIWHELPKRFAVTRHTLPTDTAKSNMHGSQRGNTGAFTARIRDRLVQPLDPKQCIQAGLPPILSAHIKVTIPIHCTSRYSSTSCPRDYGSSVCLLSRGTRSPPACPCTYLWNGPVLCTCGHQGTGNHASLHRGYGAVPCDALPAQNLARCHIYNFHLMGFLALRQCFSACSSFLVCGSSLQHKGASSGTQFLCTPVFIQM